MKIKLKLSILIFHKTQIYEKYLEFREFINENKTPVTNRRPLSTFVRNRLLKTKLFSFLSICACHVPIKKPILPTINNVHYDGDSII